MAKQALRQALDTSLRAEEHTLRDRFAAADAFLEDRDPQCNLGYVSDGAREFFGNTVLSNSFGFGGQNASLLFGRYT